MLSKREAAMNEELYPELMITSSTIAGKKKNVLSFSVTGNFRWEKQVA